MERAFLLRDVWWADQLSPTEQPTVSTGWPALDAVLPGSGWPLGAVVECALQPDGLPWRLLLPVLQAAASIGPLVLIGLPLEPNAHAWAAQGVAPGRLLRLQTDSDADALWSAEQVLRCPDVALCWVHWRQPTLAGTRRLQLAASSAKRDSTQVGAWPAPLVLASYDAAHGLPTSAAVLRLEVSAGNVDGLTVRVRKRRGPALADPVQLEIALPLRRLLTPPIVQGHTHHAAEATLDRLPTHLRFVAT